MKYAVVKIQGKQYRVQEGGELIIDRIAAKREKKIEFDQVLLVKDGKSLKIGRPLVKDAKVSATFLKDLKGEKIRVATYKAKSRYRRVKGFRSLLTKLKIEKIISQ